MKQLKTAKIGYIMISIAFYISGLCCIISPNVMGRNGKVAAGILLIAYGIIKMIGYFSKDLYCLAFQYDLRGIFLIYLEWLLLSIRNPKEGYMLAGLGILISIRQSFSDSDLFRCQKIWNDRMEMVFIFLCIIRSVGNYYHNLQDNAYCRSGTISRRRNETLHGALYSQDRAINMEERVNENSKTGGNYNECSKYFKETGNRENI